MFNIWCLYAYLGRGDPLLKKYHFFWLSGCFTQVICTYSDLFCLRGALFKEHSTLTSPLTGTFKTKIVFKNLVALSTEQGLQRLLAALFAAGIWIQSNLCASKRTIVCIFKWSLCLWWSLEIDPNTFPVTAVLFNLIKLNEAWTLCKNAHPSGRPGLKTDAAVINGIYYSFNCYY